jgi:hypothetical protein
MRNSFVPQTGHIPVVTAELLALNPATGSFTSRLVLHFIQYASIQPPAREPRSFIYGIYLQHEVAVTFSKLCKRNCRKVTATLLIKSKTHSTQFFKIPQIVFLAVCRRESTIAPKISIPSKKAKDSCAD